MKKIILLLCILLISLLMFASPLYALTFEGGRTVNIREDIDDNLYLWGGAVSVRSNINGDLFVAGGRFNLNGDIADDLTAIGAFGYIGGTVYGDVRVSGGVITLNGQVNGEVIVVGGFVIIDSNCHIMGDLVITGGSLNIIGEIEGDLIAAGGSIEILGDIGGNAEIKNVASLNIRNTATIGGNLIYSSGKEARISEGAEIKGNIVFNGKVTTQTQASASGFIKTAGPDKSLKMYAAKPNTFMTPDSDSEVVTRISASGTNKDEQSFWGAITGFFNGIFTTIYIIIKILYFLGMFIFGMVLILVLPALFRRFNDRMKSSPGKCVASGAITLYGVPVGITIVWATGIILLISVLGAAFSFILFAAGGLLLIIYGVLIFVSTVFLSYLIGELILSKSRLDKTKYGVKVLAFFIGFVITEIIYVLPVVGQVTQLVGIFFSLGGLAIILYEWIRYKDNPFRAYSPDQDNKPKTRQLALKKDKK